MTSQGLKFIVYKRKSSETDLKQIQSLSVQTEVLERYIDTLNLQIVTEFQESRSAWKTGNRPEFNKMIQLFQKKKANALLTVSVDRIARNLMKAGIFEELVKSDIIKEIHTPERIYKRQDIIDLIGRWADAAISSHNTSKRVSRAAESHANTGKVVTRRTGYRFNNYTKLLEPDSIYSKHIILMFELFSTEEHSIDSLRKELRNRNIKTQGGYYYPNSKIGKVLRDPFYYGASTYYGQIKSEKGQHQPIITKAIFNKVQNILNGRHKPKKQAKKALFRGKAFCAECYCSYTYDPKTKNGKIYEYYRCSNGKHYHPHYPPAVKENDIAFMLAPHLKDLKNEKEIAELALDVYKEELLKQKPKDNSKQIQNQIEVKQDELKKIQRKIALDVFTQEEYEDLKKDIENEINILKSEFENQMPEDLQTTFELLVNVKIKAFTAFEIFKNGNFDDKKKILNSVLSNFLIENKEISKVSLFPEYEIMRKPTKNGEIYEWLRD